MCIFTIMQNTLFNHGLRLNYNHRFLNRLGPGNKNV